MLVMVAEMRISCTAKTMYYCYCYHKRKDFFTAAEILSPFRYDRISGCKYKMIPNQNSFMLFKHLQNLPQHHTLKNCKGLVIRKLIQKEIILQIGMLSKKDNSKMKHHIHSKLVENFLPVT